MGAIRSTWILLPTLFLSLIASLYVSPVYADELAVSTNKLSYGLGATVKVLGCLTLKDIAVTDGLVAVQVEDSLGNLELIRVLSTGTSPPPWDVRITEFALCDSQGNPISSVSRGNLAYLKVAVESLDTIFERQVTITFNLFDSVGVSIAVTYAIFPLAPGKQLTYFTSIPIPKDSFTGVATGYVNALTKWPKDGGQPYCQEMRVNFTITDPSTQTTGPSSPLPSSPPGSFILPFKLSNFARLGKYAVYASARYNAWASTSFTYMWLSTDINTDGRVDIVDVSIIATIFGSKAGDPRYYSLADINRDGAISILDIASVAIDFGKKRA